MVAVALPLAPLAPGAAAAAGTFIAGSVAYVAQQVYGFRAPLPPLPRVGGKAGGPTLKELVADAIAGARIPVAMPPNPLGPRGNWAAIGAAALLGLLAKTTAQQWGSAKQVYIMPVPGVAYPSGPTKSTNGNYLRLCVAWNNTCITWLFHEFLELRYTNGRLSFGVFVYDVYAKYKLFNGTLVDEKLPGAMTLAEIQAQRVVVQPGQATTGSVQPPAAVAAGSIPAIEPSVQPPPPIPLIPAAPPTPEPNPEPEPSVVPTTPGPTAPPATAPQVPRRTFPIPLREAQTTKDGAIVPFAPAPVPVTQPDAHFPVPGAPPVTGNGPRPTPEGIAQELGRLEQKLARLSDPGPEGPGDGSDRLQLISDLIGRLIEFATSMTSGGGYGLSTPCEVDENGERIVTTVNYSGATNSLGVLSNKVDALAALLQVHKDLKQPNCKQAPAVGQPVTVNFVQVD
jgi:hypothetical protein